MANRMPNGEGGSDTVLIQFDQNDPVEKRALAMARRLATPHGRRKRLFVLFLNALADLEAAGYAVHADKLSASLIASAFTGQGRGAQVVAPPPTVESVIEITTQEKASPQVQAARFAARFK